MIGTAIAGPPGLAVGKLAGEGINLLTRALDLPPDTPPEIVAQAVQSAPPEIVDRIDQAEAQFRLRAAELAAQAIAGQVEVDKLEAASGSLFVAGWRPALGWILDAGLALGLVVQPAVSIIVRLLHPDIVVPMMDLSVIVPLTVGMLGISGYRTIEKLKGVQTRRIGAAPAAQPRKGLAAVPALAPPIFVRRGNVAPEVDMTGDMPASTPSPADVAIQQTADRLHGLYDRLHSPPVSLPPELIAPVVVQPVRPVRDVAFEAALAFTLAQEGGWSDDPHDPGGATMHGITLVTFRAWRNNPAATKDELRVISDDEVAGIYQTNYWNIVNGDALPPGIALSVFDAGVNTGPRTAAHQLQSLLGVQVDGVVGPITLAAAKAADLATFLPRLAMVQSQHYAALPDFPRYGNGWINRVHARLEAASRAATA
jgi:hypothetical protein